MTNFENLIQTFKKNNELLDGKQIYLRIVENNDVNEEYLSWLNLDKINQFLESRFTKYNLKTLEEYVLKTNQKSNILFLAIVTKTEKKFIGTIKLGPINKFHNFAELGIMIGNSEFWGKGYATEAIEILSNFAFNKIKLHKIIAGAYENNLGSIKAFLKAGFLEEGKREKHFLDKNKFVGHVLLAKFNPAIEY